MPYLVPETVEEALVLLRDRGPTILAGCTDAFASQKPGPRAQHFLDVVGLRELRGIDRTPTGWRIGAATTWTEVARAALPPAFDALKQAAAEIGAVQIQNAGTVAGNICNASPAADGVPPLLAIDARVEVGSVAGRRNVALADFITGARRIDLAPDEMVLALHVPHLSGAVGSAFLKLGGRTSLAISVAMVAAVVRIEDARLAEVRLAVGACSPVARRLPALEAHLQGQAAADLAGLVIDRAEHPRQLAPIDAMRGPARYRIAAGEELWRRALIKAAEAAGGADADAGG